MTVRIPRPTLALRALRTAPSRNNRPTRRRALWAGRGVLGQMGVAPSLGRGANPMKVFAATGVARRHMMRFSAASTVCALLALGSSSTMAGVVLSDPFTDGNFVFDSDPNDGNFVRQG